MIKINASRLRHYVKLVTPDGTNEYGEQVGDVKVFDAYAEVQVKRGNQLADYGTVLTSEVITVLMYFDSRVAYNQILQWNNSNYEVKHIVPDTEEHGMIITAERVAK